MYQQQKRRYPHHVIVGLPSVTDHSAHPAQYSQYTPQSAHPTTWNQYSPDIGTNISPQCIKDNGIRWNIAICISLGMCVSVCGVLLLYAYWITVISTNIHNELISHHRGDYAHTAPNNDLVKSAYTPQTQPTEVKPPDPPAANATAPPKPPDSNIILTFDEKFLNNSQMIRGLRTQPWTYKESLMAIDIATNEVARRTAAPETYDHSVKKMGVSTVIDPYGELGDRAKKFVYTFINNNLQKGMCCCLWQSRINGNVPKDQFKSCGPLDRSALGATNGVDSTHPPESFVFECFLEDDLLNINFGIIALIMHYKGAKANTARTHSYNLKDIYVSQCFIDMM